MLTRLKTCWQGKNVELTAYLVRSDEPDFGEYEIESFRVTANGIDLTPKVLDSTGHGWEWILTQLRTHHEKAPIG